MNVVPVLQDVAEKSHIQRRNKHLALSSNYYSFTIPAPLRALRLLYIQERIQVMINILLLIKCSYTFIGIKEMLMQHAVEGNVRIISGVKGLIEFGRDEKVHMVITESGRYPREISNTLQIPSFVSCRCILLTGLMTDIEKKFYRLAGFHYLIDSRSPRSDILRIITQCYPGGSDKRQSNKKYPKRERDVLYRILQGRNMKAISHELNISYKMVSHYKSTALHRTGAKSIVDIARGGETIRLRNHVYSLN